MEIQNLANNIEKKSDGIYYSKSNSSISYPEEGNENCMQIEEDSFWFKHRNNVIYESVKLHSKESVFFDIGGGNGFVSKKMQNEGLKVVLVEPGNNGAINAKKRGVNTIVCSTLENAGFENSCIDSVGLFDVVEHIEDDIKFLKEINKFVKENGYLYITVPAYKNLWSKEDIDAGHYRRYTTKLLKKRIEEAGFEVIYVSYLFSLLPIPIFFFRTIPSFFGLNKNSDDLNKYKKEHNAKKGIFSKLIEKIWIWELNRVKRFKKIFMGSSCFAIARKKTI